MKRGRNDHRKDRRFSGGRSLAPEERSLWRNVTKDVVPLARENVVPDDGARDIINNSSSDPMPQGVVPGSQMRTQKVATRQALLSTPSRGIGAGGDVFTGGNPHIDRRVARGRTPIEATLDLHGHTQLTARRVFETFIGTARARGYRCVLVITGKGDASSGKGVLRTRLRDWVNEAGFRDQIIRVSQAHPRHGGGGAFYIFLKALEKKKRK